MSAFLSMYADQIGAAVQVLPQVVRFPALMLLVTWPLVAPLLLVCGALALSNRRTR